MLWGPGSNAWTEQSTVVPDKARPVRAFFFPESDTLIKGLPAERPGPLPCNKP